jgi:ferredoxin
LKETKRSKQSNSARMQSFSAAFACPQQAIERYRNRF